MDNFEITLTEEYKEELREKARVYAQLLAENDVVITTMEQINSQENEPSSSDKPVVTLPAEPNVLDEEGEHVPDTEQTLIEEGEIVPEEEQELVEEEAPQTDDNSQTESPSKRKKGKKHLLDGKFEIKYLKKQKTYKPPVDPSAENKDQV